MSSEELTRKRATVKAKLTSFQSFLRKLEADPSKEWELTLRLERAENLLSEHEEIQHQIEIMSDVDIDERTRFEDTYYTVIASGRELANRLRASSSQESAPLVTTNLTTHANSLLKLPSIDLPTFSGEYDQWVTFWDTFEAIIDSNVNLTKVQKFHYLQSSVKGRAAQCFQSLSLSNENYEAAWKLLKSRFENKRLIVHHHVQALLDLPVLSKESCFGLRKLIDDMQQHLCALTKLEQPVQTWDTLLIHLTIPKLDFKTKREWEFKREFTSLPNMAEFMEFLNKRCFILETLSSSKSRDISSFDLRSHKRSLALTTQSSIGKQCPLCKNLHWLYACPSFRKLTVPDRLREAERLKVCLNCLRFHNDYECTFGGCQRCKRRHNTLLHCDVNGNSRSKATNVESENSITKKVENPSLQPSVTITTSHCATGDVVQTLVATAIVFIRDNNGEYQECRALLDSASQGHFMTKNLCQRLQLKSEKTNHLVHGLGQVNIFVNDKTTTVIRSRYNDYHTEISCFVVNSITSILPSEKIDTRQIMIPKNIQLADPKYDIPTKIDLLIGVELFYDLLQEQSIKLDNKQPTLRKTELGWIIGGPLMYCKSVTQCKASQCYLSLNTQIQRQLEQFWTLEEIDQAHSYTKNEQSCEDNFITTHQRDQHGRFIVQLPFKDLKISSLGKSREIAEKRLRSMERKFEKDIELKESYTSFMREYEDLGHMTQVEEAGDADECANYLPHHAVIKSTSTTTKLRVVFDASCKTTSGKALNDILLVGPTIQNTLFNIMLRFRQHTYVLTADISKIYRQVLLQSDQRNLQRVLWRKVDGEIRAFRLNTVTYGLASASFLVIRCLFQLALEHKDTLPEASTVIMRDFYVDDLISGGNELNQLKILKKNITKILLSGGFEMHKWNSNEASILHNGSEKNVEPVSFGKVNTLGLTWNTKSDTFQYRSDLRPRSTRPTKRIILAIVSQIFDPLGLVGPITVQSKLLLQDLWQLKIGWDNPIPTKLRYKWIGCQDQLQGISEISISRHAFNNKYIRVELHGFCDASEAAYGGCIYVKTEDTHGDIIVKLLCAKSKVAPLKRVSLPRLELCAALLLARLYQQVIRALTVKSASTYFWSDSTITLAWVKEEPSRWVQFVANRVAEVQRLTEPLKWFHVNSKENPADIISRGMRPDQLKTCRLWWNGPEWLRMKTQPLHYESVVCNEDLPDERRTTKTFHVQVSKDELFLRFSSLSRLKRVIAYCLRFKKNALHRETRTIGPLTVTELERAMTVLILIAQQSDFTNEMEELKLQGKVNKSSRLRSLLPFLDNQSVMRIGGRLSNAPIPYAQRHPIILSPKHSLTRLIILHEHYRHLHAGPQALLAAIRTQFWSLNARRAVRNILRKCIICFRSKPPILYQQMGDLPATRVTMSRPFLSVGIDYGGPFIIKVSRNKTDKAYLCIFVCFTTRAVHLELVVYLSTSAFIRALQRFIARRGKCARIYSDNAKNFVGANNELRYVIDMLRDPESHVKISDFLSGNSIKWTFIPPHSPHMGGLWEAAVKSAKTHLRRIVGTTPFSYEELYTLLTQIEACLNSRPLCPISDDGTDLCVLTPGHFVIGVPLTSLPEVDVSDVPSSRLTRHRLLIQMRQHFWRR